MDGLRQRHPELHGQRPEALSNLVPPVSSDERYRIVATDSVFEFAAIPVDGRSRWGIVNARIAIEQSADGTFAIVFRQRQRMDEPRSGMPEAGLFLFGGLTSAALQYSYRTPLGLRSAPTTPGQSPEIVTLKWRKAGEPGQLESVSFRTRLDAGADCQLDLQSLRCR